MTFGEAPCVGCGTLYTFEILDKEPAYDGGWWYKVEPELLCACGEPLRWMHAPSDDEQRINSLIERAVMVYSDKTREV